MSRTEESPTLDGKERRGMSVYLETLATHAGEAHAMLDQIEEKFHGAEPRDPKGPTEVIATSILASLELLTADTARIAERLGGILKAL